MRPFLIAATTYSTSRVRMMEFHLFEKTELLIENIHLSHVNLGRVASSVAAVLGFDSRDAAVIDVRPGTVAIDILRTEVTLEHILGKGEALLLALRTIDGVTVTDETTVHSEGILGLVNVSQDRYSSLETGVNKIARQIDDAVRLRAMVFPTGEEIIKGDIEDTN